MKLFSYTVDKNYMFLLCNGLLVFIVKNSGLVGKSPFGDDLTEEHVMKKEGSRPSVRQLSENKAMDGSENVLMDVEEEKEMADWPLVPVGNGDEGEEEDSRPSVPQLSENKAMDGSKNVLMDVEEEKEMADLSLVTVGNGDEGEEDEAGEGPEMMSAEELHKRCDDFIRRMKEGIKIESRS
jgi:hypothetical protein